jgi:hypothetical protein
MSKSRSERDDGEEEEQVLCCPSTNSDDDDGDEKEDEESDLKLVGRGQSNRTSIWWQRTTDIELNIDEDSTKIFREQTTFTPDLHRIPSRQMSFLVDPTGHPDANNSFPSRRLTFSFPRNSIIYSISSPVETSS